MASGAQPGRSERKRKKAGKAPPQLRPYLPLVQLHLTCLDAPRAAQELCPETLWRQATANLLNFPTHTGLLPAQVSACICTDWALLSPRKHFLPCGCFRSCKSPRGQRSRNASFYRQETPWKRHKNTGLAYLAQCPKLNPPGTRPGTAQELTKHKNTS